MRPAKIVLVVVGAVLALASLGLVAAGGTLVWAHLTQRDATGFYATPTELLHTTSYALTSQVDLGARPSEQDWVPAHPLGTVRIRANAVTGGGVVFIGIGRQAEVDAWLAGVPHTHVTSLSFGPFETHTQEIFGTRAPVPPASEPFWVASASGTGTRAVVWPTVRGRWSAVVMNADATRGVAVQINVGAKTGLLLPIGLGVGAFGLLLLAGGALLLVLGLRQPTEQAPEMAGSTAEAPAPTSLPARAVYPVRVDGQLDPTTSRWLWLVKWILVIPHAIVLAFLWLAALVLTLIAGVAILFTGHYPRPIFEFNAGVFRWTWRVAFYAIGAFGTDRYPPFGLAADPGYPADLTIAYPEHLSRGLVLVKWWLLALPQYLVVAVFAGGWGISWLGWRSGASGLIPLLAVIAAVILAVRGRYPDSIFEFVMGMNRWCCRVLAYAALMTDEYPPFRLDLGGTDPSHQPVLPPIVPSPDRGGQLLGSHP
jgi:hypothetical protein